MHSLKEQNLLWRGGSPWTRMQMRRNAYWGRDLPDFFEDLSEGVDVSGDKGGRNEALLS